LWLYLVQYQWSLINGNVPSLHNTHGFQSFVCIGKPTRVSHAVKAYHRFQLLKSTPHNSILNYNFA
jgi:hypothetical protein